jgi:hypothetical protein
MQIFVARSGKNLGTFSFPEVQRRLTAGEFLPTDHAWAEGQADWIRLAQFPGLKMPAPTAPAPAEPPLKETAPKEPAKAPAAPAKPQAGGFAKVESAASKAEPKLVLNVDPPPRSEAEFELKPAGNQTKPKPEPEPEPEPPSNLEPEPALELKPVPAPKAPSRPEPEPEPEDAEPEPDRLPITVADLLAVTQSTAPKVSARSALPRGPVPTSGLAVASLICGVFSFLLLPALPAIVCGHLARARIRTSKGRLEGAGMALAGLILGYAGFGIAYLLFSIITSAAQTKARETLSLAHAREIAMACQAYATDHQGVFPQDLEQLVPKYVPDPEVFVCPLSGPVVLVGYEYYGGRETDPPNNILLASKALTRRHGRVIACVDLNVRIVRNMPTLPPH